MTELTLARVEEHCHRLGLPHLKAALGEALGRAEAEGWGQVQLLDRLLET